MAARSASRVRPAFVLGQLGIGALAGGLMGFAWATWSAWRREGGLADVVLPVALFVSAVLVTSWGIRRSLRMWSDRGS